MARELRFYERLRQLPRDPEKSARFAGLRYTSDQVPGYARVAAGKKFRYIDASGKTIRDKKELTRIGSLVIPPAWTKVWISRSGTADPDTPLPG